MKSLFLSCSLLAIFIISACHHQHSTDVNELVADWNATSIKTNGTAEPAPTSFKLSLKTGDQFTITTNISPFSQPISGVWAANSGTTELDLAGNIWVIHHLSSSSLRLIGKVSGKELDIDFVK